MSHFILVQLLHFEIASFPSVQNTTSRVVFYSSVLCGRKSCFCFKKDYFIWFHSLTVLAKDLNVVSSPHNKYFIVCWFIMHTLYQKYIIKIFRGAIVKSINGADNFNVWKICRIYVNTCVNCWFCGFHKSNDNWSSKKKQSMYCIVLYISFLVKLLVLHNNLDQWCGHFTSWQWYVILIQDLFILCME